MSVELANLARDWDRAFEATLGTDANADERRPYSRLLQELSTAAPIRFQPYQNDNVPVYLAKLRSWLQQFTSDEQRVAFLLAANVVYVTQRQMEALQKVLMRTCIRKHILDAIIARDSLPPFSYLEAEKQLTSEMDATLFVPLSDSSPVNSFAHVNSDYFADRARRNLSGPSVEFWTYPSRRAASMTGPNACLAAWYQSRILHADTRLAGKRRLVVIEDFSGSGSDLIEAVKDLVRAALPVEEVVLAPTMATAEAMKNVAAECVRATSQSCRYLVMTAFELPQTFRCFDGPNGSYLDAELEPHLSGLVKQLCDRVWADVLKSKVPPGAKYGLGGLALAFAFYTNCPDNSLPILWAGENGWRPLFRRASRWI